MGIGGIWQWVVVLAIVLILFGGRGKISQLMGDFGRGLRSFKNGVKEDPKIIDADDDSSVVESSSTEEVPNKDKG